MATVNTQDLSVRTRRAPVVPGSGSQCRSAAQLRTLAASHTGRPPIYMEAQSFGAIVGGDPLACGAAFAAALAALAGTAEAGTR
jgi:hypothetical protein